MLAVLIAVTTAGLAAGVQPPKRNAMASKPSRLRDPGPWTITTWAHNTDAWNRKLHVSVYRFGCSTVAECLEDGEESLQRQNILEIVASMPMKNPEVMTTDAREYSLISQTNPFLIEVSFDDFVDRYQRLFFSGETGTSPVLETVLQNVKSANPNLKFGITLYEDELGSSFLRPPRLPLAVAERMNTVRLYIHYRMDAQHYPEYVQQAKALFPNAQIVAGSYAYDRVDYIPCSPSSRAPCSPEQDIAFYQQSIQIQADLLKQGAVAGIEFYPGFFGLEERWQSWNDPEICKPARRQQCIDDTKAMRREALTVLDSTLGW
jgi:hypothetical protein